MSSSRSCFSPPQPMSPYCRASSCSSTSNRLRTSAAAQGLHNPHGKSLLICILHLAVHFSMHSLRSTQHTHAYQELLAVPKPAAAILTRQHKRKRFTGDQRTVRVKLTVQLREETDKQSTQTTSHSLSGPAAVSKLLQALFSVKPGLSLSCYSSLPSQLRFHSAQEQQKHPPAPGVGLEQK